MLVESRTTEDTLSTSKIVNLVDEELQVTLDALNTTIAMKQAAIKKEKKKRSKIDTNAIGQWEKEIESIARSIDRLQSLSNPRKG